MFIELNYAGGSLDIEKVMINLDSISCLEKLNNESACKCIIVCDNGEKYPVKETYDEIIDRLKKIYQNHGFRN